MTTQARELAKLVNNSGDVNLVDDITLGSDGALLNFGADSDVVITHVADTGLLLNSSRQLQFGDSGTHIRQSADGVLQLTSDTEVEINATTIDINGNVDISGNLVLGGNITIGDADSDDISFGGELTSHIIPNADDTFDLGSSTKQWRNVYVDGTLEADAITVDGTSLSVITTENVQDIVGAMVTSNTETNITVTYEDSDGTLDFVVPSTLSGVTELGTLTTLQVDNININGNTVTSTSSDLIVDASHNIYLDADGGNIVLQDGGTSFGQFIKSAGNLRIYNPISDGDIQILGNDGGSAITALEFDMSNAGNAIFNSDILINDGKKIKAGNSQDLEIYHSGSHSHIHDVGSGNLYLDTNGAQIDITYNTNNENMAQFIANGAVQLYYDNTLKFLTSSTGINLPVDGDKIQFGANSEVQLVHEHDVGLSLNGGGALILADNNTDDTNKTAYLVARQYDSGSETEGFLTIQTFGNSSGNRIDIGGGTSQRNASTEINFYTAANTTTRTGTNRMVVNSSGINVTGAVDGDNFKINGAQGSDGQLMTSTGSGVAWEDAPASGPSKGLAIAFSMIF